MAANISMRNGKAEAFTALKPAWWDYKKQYLAHDYLTSDEVWGERGLLNFEYELRALKCAETGVGLGKYRHCVRKDNGVTVGCGMTNEYQIIQPREAFAFLDDLMRDGIMKYASAGVLGKGEEIWILGTIPNDDQPIPGETHQRYVLWTDRFDASGSLKCFPCVTRVECANTLAMAQRERNATIYKGIRHTGDMQAKLVEARNILMQQEEIFQQYNSDCRKLVATRYTRDVAKEYIEQLFPTPEDKGSKRSKTIRDNQVQAVREAMMEPCNNLGEMKGTFWQLVNAVTYAVDHSEVFTFRGEDKVSNRFRSLMTGKAANFKREAFDLALALAG